MSTDTKYIIFHMDRSNVIDLMGIQINLVDLENIVLKRYFLIDWAKPIHKMYFTLTGVEQEAFKLQCSYSDFCHIMSFYTNVAVSPEAEKAVVSNHLNPDYWRSLHSMNTRERLEKKYINGERVIRNIYNDDELEIFNSQLYSDSAWEGGLDRLNVEDIDTFRMFQVPLFGFEPANKLAQEPLYCF